jgi:hypothetical protein
MKYEFHPEALAEYEEAARYYAGCPGGLDLRFIASVEAAIKGSTHSMDSAEKPPS